MKSTLKLSLRMVGVMNRKSTRPDTHLGTERRAQEDGGLQKIKCMQNKKRRQAIESDTQKGYKWTLSEGNTQIFYDGRDSKKVLKWN